jgi:hypothetical protein
MLWRRLSGDGSRKASGPERRSRKQGFQLTCITHHYEQQDKSFGSGSFARNLFEHVVEKQAARAGKTFPPTGEILLTRTGWDIPAIGEVDRVRGGRGFAGGGR